MCCGIVPCSDFKLCYLLNFAKFPAFYLDYSTQYSLCVELLQVSDNEIMNSMINEEGHVFEKFARGHEGVTGCRSVS